MVTGAAQFGDHQFFEAGFQLQADSPRRARNRLRQFVGAHRAEQIAAVFEGILQDQVVQAVCVEVGPQRDHHGDRIIGALGAAVQHGQELLAFLLAVTRGEQFLELVDDQQPPRTAAARSQRRADHGDLDCGGSGAGICWGRI